MDVIHDVRLLYHASFSGTACDSFPAQELTSNRILDAELAFVVRRIMTKLLCISRQPPQGMKLDDVARAVDPHGKLLDVAFEGGFGDVYRGVYGGSVVAIKRIRPLARLGLDHEKASRLF